MLARHVRHGVMIWRLEDPDDLGSFRLLYANPSADREGGSATQPFVGTTVAESFPALLETDAPAIYAEAIRTGHLREVPALRYAGRLFSVRVVPLEGADVALFYTNIADREERDRALRESDERYQDLYDNAPDAYFSVDIAAGTIVDCNRTAVEVTGYTREELIGLPPFDLYHPDSLRDAQAAFEAFLATGELRDVELQAKRKDGGRLGISLSATAIRDERGTIVRSRSIWRDISDRLAVERALRENERRLEAILRMSPDAVIACDERGTILYASNSVQDSLGWPPEQLVGQQLTVLIPDRFKARHASAFHRAVMAPGARLNRLADVQAVHRNGSLVPVEVHVATVEPGHLMFAAVAMVRDVSKRVLAERALRESEERARVVLTNVPVVLFALDRDAIFTLSEGRGLDALGLQSGEVVGRSAFEVYRDMPDVIRDLLAAFSGEVVSGTLQAVDDLVFETYLNPVRDAAGEVDGLIGVAVDVTERVRAQRALRDSDERMRSVFESSAEGIVAYDTDIHLTLWSPAMERLTGVPAAEAVGRSPLDMFPFLDSMGEGDAFRQAVRGQATRKPAMRMEEPGTGVIRYFESAHVPLRGAGGEIDGGMAIIRDVTERVRAEQAQRASEERLSTVFETAQDGMVLFDQRGRAQLFNEALCRMLGYSRPEMEQVPLARMLHPDDREMVIARLASRVRGEDVPSRYRIRLVRKDGEVITVEASASPVMESGKIAGVLGELRDVTEELRLREQLIVAQKSEALATLVAGVAHDFNNLLTALSGSIDLARRRPTEPRWLDNATAATRQATELVRQLLQFSRHDEPRRARVSLAQLVAEAATLARGTFDRRIALDIDAPEGLPEVMADAGQVEQVIVNLLVNARDAVLSRLEAEPRDPGYAPRISVALRACDDAACDCETHPCVTITVLDNGTGMPPEVRERIFDPFFTTKGPGRGTGLGLSTAYGVIAEHAGTITVSSRPGAGATFTVQLPSASATAAPPESAVAAPSRPSVGPGGASGSVLLVDDEQPVLAAGEVALVAAGYDVVAVSSGTEALDAIAQRSFDVAVVDVNMAPPDGWEVLDRIRRDSPGTRVVMSSGLAPGRDVRERGAAGFLEKPYSLAALVAAITEARDAELPAAD